MTIKLTNACGFVILVLLLTPVRALGVTYVVNSALDLPDSYPADGICDITNNPTTSPPIPPSKICTLRAAIQQANITPGLNEIDILVPGAIQPATGLPAITKPVILRTGMTSKAILDGYLLSAGGVGLVVSGGGSTIEGLSIIRFQGTGIELDSSGNRIYGSFVGLTPSGTGAGNGTGIAINNGSNNTIGDSRPHHQNVISNNTQTGITIQDGSGNTIQSNYIGTDATGATALGNTSAGVFIRNSTYNLIGGSATAERNIISGNGGGVWIEGGNGNKIFGNYIGPDVTGNNNVGNHGAGVSIQESTNNLIGQPSPGPAVTTFGPKTPTTALPPGNVISNNDGVGVDIQGKSSSGNRVEGNFIGTDALGRNGRGNSSEGVFINNASKNFIGSAASGAGNLISFNGGGGIQIADTEASQNTIQANWIGLDITGQTALGNAEIGIYINGAPNNLIGGDSDATRNVISGNGWKAAYSGIHIQGSSAQNNRVQSNYIGLSANGRVALPNAGDGVAIIDAPKNIIGGIYAPPFTPRNFISGNSETGIAISGADAHDNQIEGNYIGTDLTGKSLPLATIGGTNVQQVGIWIQDAPTNKIGGNTQAFGNLISGSVKSGLIISGKIATANRIEGNYIGTDVTGKVALANGESGVAILEAPGNFIGASTPRAGDAPGNLISGNKTSQKGGAVEIEGGDATGNDVKGNLIGTQQDGTSPLPNDYDGVFITINPTTGRVASQTKIGGLKKEDGNVIAFNGRDGVDIDEAKTGPDSTGNAILSNLIYSNKKLGIDLGAKGKPLINWVRKHAGVFPSSASTGPNLQQQYPVLYLPASGGVGTLDSLPNKSFTLQFFSCPLGDVSGFGQGKSLIQTLTVNTDQDGFESFQVPLPNPKEVLGATATDADNNTSEFAKLCCMDNPDPDLVGNTNWLVKSSSTVPQATLSKKGSPINKPVLPIKYEGTTNLYLHVHAAKTNATPDDDLTKAFVTIAVSNLDWRKKGAASEPAMIYTEAQPLDSAGNADVFIDPDKVLKALAVGENKNFVEATVKVCYRGRTLSLQSDNLLHVMLERMIVFLPGVLGSEIWVNDPGIFPPPFNTSTERQAYPVPIGVVTIPGYTSWREYQARYLDLKYKPTKLKLFTHVDLSTVPLFNLFIPPGYKAATIYDVQTPLQKAIDDQLPNLQIGGQRVLYYHLQAWPYDWRQKVEDHVSALRTGGCTQPGCFGADPRYASPPTLQQIISNGQSISKFMDDRVTLVGHSTGGLIIRSALNDLSFRQLVDRAFFVNTPFLGAPKAYYAYLTGNMVPAVIAPWVLRKLAPNIPIVYYLAPAPGYVDPNSTYPGGTKVPDVVMIYPGGSGTRALGVASANYMNPAIAAYTGSPSTWNTTLATAADTFHLTMRATRPSIGWRNTVVFWSQGQKTPAPAVVRGTGTATIGDTEGDGTVPTSSQVGGLPNPLRTGPPLYSLEENIASPVQHDQAANQPFIWSRIVEELETPILAGFDGKRPIKRYPDPKIYPSGLTNPQRELIGEAEMTRITGPKFLRYETILAASAVSTPRQGFDALYCDGKKVSQVTDPVYYACDGTLVVGEGKGGYAGQDLEDIMGKGYDYRQGTIEWAHKAALYVLTISGATKASASTQFLDALANGQTISVQVFHADFKMNSGAGAGITNYYISDSINPP